MPRCGLRVHERLRARVGRRRSAFDRVRREREGRAAETDERHATGELDAQHADRFEHVRERFARLEVAQAIDVGRGANRAARSRALRP